MTKHEKKLLRQKETAKKTAKNFMVTKPEITPPQERTTTATERDKTARKQTGWKTITWAEGRLKKVLDCVKKTITIKGVETV